MAEKPQINISRSTTGRMWLVFGCSALAVIQSAAGDSGASLVVALTAFFSAILAELLITQRKSGFKKIQDGSAAAAAMVFSLLLPNQIHPAYAAAGALFAVAVVKQSFGGLGSNWLNPALGGWLFVRLSWPEAFARALETSPFSAEFLQTGAALTRGSAFDLEITNFLNGTIFALTRAELPPGYIDLLCSPYPGIIADRGLLALLAGTVIITAFKISHTWVPAVFLGVFGFLVRLAGSLPLGGPFWNGDVLFGFFSGGTVAAAFIIAAEPASGAKSRQGIAFTAVLAAILSWIFRYWGFALYGCFAALALVNALIPAVRFFEQTLLFSRRKKIASGETV
jgi:electron transport complex protein RnfD